MKTNNPESMFFGASPEIFRRSEKLRNQMTQAEQIFWQELKEKKLDGLKFRRQHALQNFIADFYCHKKKIVIELDGSIHNRAEQVEYDSGRTAELNNFGIKVLRFKNEEVINNVAEVIRKIRKSLIAL